MSAYYTKLDLKKFKLMRLTLLIGLSILLIGCATNGTSNIDPSVWEDLSNISEALLEGKSYSEALSEVKY